MNRTVLIDAIHSKKSFLCVGLDSDRSRIPDILRTDDDPVFTFNRQIIDATHRHCIAYKINTAFYEAQGSRGWNSLEKTADYIPDTHLLIIDAKRGDIGNTSRQYARAFFDQLSADALTISPYMGSDSVKPFIRKEKWVIILALTSNVGARDVQLLSTSDQIPLYQQVIKTCRDWGTAENTMFVVGATNPSHFQNIRTLIPNHFLLVPGIGKQGGSLEVVCEQALTDDVGLIVNASRSVIFASGKEDFADEASKAASHLHDQMKQIMDQYDIG